MQPDKERFMAVSFEQSVPLLASLFETMFSHKSKLDDIPPLQVMHEEELYDEDGTLIDERSEQWHRKKVRSITIQRRDAYADGEVSYLAWELQLRKAEYTKNYVDGELHSSSLFGTKVAQLVNYGQGWELDFGSEFDEEDKQFITEQFIDEKLLIYLEQLHQILLENPTLLFNNTVYNIGDAVDSDPTATSLLRSDESAYQFLSTVMQSSATEVIETHRLRWKTAGEGAHVWRMQLEVLTAAADVETIAVDLAQMDFSGHELNAVEDHLLHVLRRADDENTVIQFFRLWRKVNNATGNDLYVDEQREEMHQDIQAFMHEHPREVAWITYELFLWARADLFASLQDSVVSTLLQVEVSNWAQPDKRSESARLVVHGENDHLSPKDVIRLSDPENSMSQMLLTLQGMLHMISSFRTGHVRLR